MKKLIKEFECPGDHPNSTEIRCGQKVQVFLTDSTTLVEHTNPPCRQFATLSPADYRHYVLSKNEPKRVLYAVAAEYSNRKDERGNDIWHPEIYHCHASNEAMARWIYTQSCEHRLYKIVSAAPVIGFFVKDNHGEKLSTE
jgi:hypothetical protein